MALTDFALNAMATELASIATHAQLHSGAPGGSGTSNVIAGMARQPISWDAASSGDISLTGTEDFSGGAASEDCTHVSIWDAITAGNYLGSFTLTGDQTLNAAGEYTLTDITINGSST